MNRQRLLQLFPNASASFIAANSQPDECEDIDGIDIGPVYASYLRTGSVHRTGKEFGVTGDTVHQWLKRAGKKLSRSKWSSAELHALRQAYANPDGVNLAKLALELGRPHAGIACKAEEIGLTSDRGTHKRTPEALKSLSKAKVEQWKKQPHPKGFAGKTHTQETKDKISEKGIGRVVPPEQTVRAMKTKLAKYGSLNPGQKRGSWKAAWREIGGQRCFFRSRWEANYARYLQFLQESGEILKWEHEPETFWFHDIQRGTRSYLPDFRITFHTGSIEYHEVKGWMDDGSKTKIKRMAKYYPSVVLIVRDAKWFKANSRNLSKFIPGWES